MANKKGLSDIIVTVLLVLLALGGIAIIWYFVSPFVTKTTSQVSSDCFTVKMEVDSCDVKLTAGSVNYYSWKIKRDPGVGEVGDLKFIISVYNSTSQTTTERVITRSNMSTGPNEQIGKLPAELESALYVVSSQRLADYGLQSSFTNPNDKISISVAPVITPTDGSESIICQPTTAPATCTKS